MKSILLGYEIGTGKGNAVEIPLSHLIVTGLTQLSGKTTTLEALITRSDLKAIVFRTKPGERGFANAQRIAPYFKERSDWQYVCALLEATLKEKMRFERSWIMTACKGTSSLLEVKRNIETALANPKTNSLSRSVYTTLDEYFNLILPQISVTTFSHTLDIQTGINVMDLEKLREELQSLIIRSVLEIVLKEMHDVIVVIPEAWKFMPQERGNPCKQLAEEFIRQGATNHNYLWIDSQDMSGVDKTPLKQVSTWILGLQSERNEVRHTLDQMPIPKKLRPAEDEIMTLKRGHFYACTPQWSKKVYVQPAWLENEKAIAIATGGMSVDEIQRPLLATLPALPPLPKQIPDEKLIALEQLQKEIQSIRKDFFGQVKELTDYVSNVAASLAAASGASAAVMVNAVDPDQIALTVMQKLPNKDILIAEITKAVLSQIPKGGSVNGIIHEYEVAPLVVLQKKFLQEAKDRLVKLINALPEDQQKVLLFVESLAKGVEHGQICEKCFGWKTSGDYSTKVKNMRLALKAAELLRVDDKARSFPYLKEKIRSEIALHGATDEEIDQLYNHILAEVLK
jgi:hypothetical protein